MHLENPAVSEGMRRNIVEHFLLLFPARGQSAKRRGECLLLFCAKGSVTLAAGLYGMRCSACTMHPNSYPRPPKCYSLDASGLVFGEPVHRALGHRPCRAEHRWYRARTGTYLQLCRHSCLPVGHSAHVATSCTLPPLTAIPPCIFGH